MTNTNPVLVHALRGGVVESAHRGSVAVVDTQGRLVWHVGDIERPVFPRSAVKALQALPLLESGAAQRWQLSDAELALACASHGGEAQHTQVAASMLAKAGVDMTVLECGAHWPYHDSAGKALLAAGQTPCALHNNCSGKHAGFVCLGCAMAGDEDPRAYLRGYVAADHPVMREVTASLQNTTGFDLSRAPMGIDGCSIPTYAVPLRHLAHAFARFGTGVGLRSGQAAAAQQLRQAVANAPHMVAGTGRFDSRVMARLGEQVFCKVGAEGMYCAALPSLGLGLAIKVDDGNTSRASEVALAALLEKLLGLSADDQSHGSFLRGLSDLPLNNWNGTEVGRLQAASALR